MKRFNRILAALLAALMLCGSCTTVAEMDVELNLNAQANPGSIELEIDPESGANIPDGGLALDEGLQLDGVDLPNPELEIGIEDNLLIDDAEAQGDGPVQSNDSDSDFVIDENGMLLEYKGKGGDVVIPDGVKKIGEFAFYHCVSLTSVTMPDSVTEICGDGSYDDGAFSGCTNLESVSFSNNLTNIGGNSFYCCKNLSNAVLPDSVTCIGNDAFDYCISLTSITIPASVTCIGNDAFIYCKNLTSVKILSKTVEMRSFVDDYDGYPFFGCNDDIIVNDIEVLTLATQAGTNDRHLLKSKKKDFWRLL